MGKRTRALRHRGVIGASWSVLRRSGAYNAVWNTLTSRRPFGTNVFTRDWDLLVLIDTGRPDAVRKLLSKYDWLTDVQSVRSVGSSSPEWYLNTFSEDYADEIEETALISANIYAHRVLDQWTASTGAADDFLKKGCPVWKQVPSDSLAHFEQITGMIDQYETLHSESSATPHVATDRAISVAREHDPERLIIHYTLPHVPFIAGALDWFPDQLSTEELMDGPEETRSLRAEETGYQRYVYGDLSRQDAYRNYLGNLQLVFDYIDVLRKNVGAQSAVISADHGEALGEWGLWDHQHGYPFGPMRIVPWAPFEATDKGTYEPQYNPPGRMPNEQDRRAFLEDMGYL